MIYKHFSKIIDYEIIKKQIRFSFPLIPFSIAIWLKSGIDILIISNELGLASVGVYSFAFTINSIFAMLAQAFFDSYNPYAFNILSKKTITYKDKIQLVKTSYFFMMFFLLILIIGYITSFFVINLFFIEKFSESIRILPYLLLSNFFMTFFSLFSIFLLSKQKTKNIGFITFFSASVQVLLIYILIQKFSLIGVAFSHFFASFIAFIMIVIKANKIEPLPWIKFKSLFFHN